MEIHDSIILAIVVVLFFGLWFIGDISGKGVAKLGNTENAEVSEVDSYLNKLLSRASFNERREIKRLGEEIEGRLSVGVEEEREILESTTRLNTPNEENYGRNTLPFTMRPRLLTEEEKTVQKRRSYLISNGQEITVEGKLEVLVIDNFEEGKTEIRYFVYTDRGKRYRIFPYSTIKTEANLRVSVSGMQLGDEIAALSIIPLGEGPDQREITGDNVGEQRLAVMLVNSQGNPITPITPEEAHDSVFDDTNFDSINSYVKAVSYDQTFLSGDTFGWYTLPLEEILLSEFYQLIELSIEAADPDINFSNYSRLLIVTPFSGLSIAGIGTVGKQSFITDEGVMELSVSAVNGEDQIDDGTGAHELGHNFGLLHANYFLCDEPSDLANCNSLPYGDLFDIMGQSSRKGHFNSFHLDEAGWLEVSNILETNEDGMYRLEPLEVAGLGIKGLKIPTSDGFSYYVEYRRSLGYDTINANSVGQGVFDGAMIHVDIFLSGGDTQLIDVSPGTDASDVVLMEGQTFVDEDRDVVLTTMAVTDEYLDVYLGNLPSFCGNGDLDFLEDCDGVNLGGQSCSSLGYVSGGLSCSSDCSFNLSECLVPICQQGEIFNGGYSCTSTFTTNFAGRQMFVSVESGEPWAPLRYSPEGAITPSYPYPPFTFWHYTVAGFPSSQRSFLYRTYIPFDTSFLPNRARLMSAQIILQVLSFENSHPSSNDFLALVPFSLTTPPYLSTEDFDNFGDINNPVELANRVDVSEEISSTLKVVFDLNSEGLENLNRGGNSSFGLRSGYDLFNEEPNSGEPTDLLLDFYSHENIFNRPLLTINYENVDLQCSCGDLNQDGDIDLSDFSLFASCFGASPFSEVNGINCYCSDLDADGDIDLSDFGHFAELYNTEPSGESCPWVPLTECNDGIDNDGDGFIDYTRAIPLNCNWLDHDADGTIRENDVEDWYVCFNPPGGPPAPGCEWADATGDGFVDLADFGELAVCINNYVFPDVDCSSEADNDETGPVKQCGDGIDNDEDGDIDLADDSCISTQDNTENYPLG